MSTTRRLDEKLQRIRAGQATRRDFILADAKDADMAFGVTAPGPGMRAPNAWKSLEEYRQQMRDVIAQGIVDIVLLSASNLEQLAIKESRFAGSAVTPAARANDSSDIWLVRGGRYHTEPSRPFRTATIEHIKYGRLTADCSAPAIGADLGLYSLTFSNRVEADWRTLDAFAAFRHEAEAKNFRYFLEVFLPNVRTGIAARDLGAFLNDHIVRALAGVPAAGRPRFLKIPYLGPGPLEELVAADPTLVVGILGGAAGTTFDAFQLLAEAQQHGAWLALFGRKINLSEHPLTFIEFLRRVADGEIPPSEAVKAYHDALAKLRVRPHRPLRADLLPSPAQSARRTRSRSR